MKEYTLKLGHANPRPLPENWETMLFGLREMGYTGDYEMFITHDTMYLMRVADLTGQEVWACSLPED